MELGKKLIAITMLSLIITALSSFGVPVLVSAQVDTPIISNEITQLTMKIKDIEEIINQNDKLPENANLVYLLDQFYSNSWNKLLIVFGAVGVLVGVAMPLFIEYLRKNSNKKEIEQHTVKLKNFEKNIQEEFDNLKNEFESLSGENESIVNRIKEEALKRQKETIEMIMDLLIDVSLDEDVMENIENKLKLIETDIERSSNANLDKLPYLNISIDDNVLYGNTVREFYSRVFEYLNEKIKDFDKYANFSTGKIRYLINKENKHLNGEKFTSPLKVDKYYIETHKSKAGALKDLNKYLKTIKEIQVKS